MSWSDASDTGGAVEAQCGSHLTGLIGGPTPRGGQGEGRGLVSRPLVEGEYVQGRRGGGRGCPWGAGYGVGLTVASGTGWP